ncbi:MAG: PaaI family thioesterase [Rhodospirillales bacterium]
MNSLPPKPSSLDEAALQATLQRLLPARDLHGVIVETCQGGEVRLRFPFDKSFVGPGNIFSGPTLLSFADTAIYAAAQAAYGDTALPLTSTINVTFLKAAQATDIVSLSRVIRRGKRLAHVEAWLFNHVAIDAISHVTASCAIVAVK